MTRTSNWKFARQYWEVAALAAFAPASTSRVSQALNVRSKSVPFIDQPPALDGKLPGDVGFDPLGLSSLWADKDWGENVVPSDCFLELMTGAAIYDQSRGSGRVAGEFNFDPLNFSKDPAAKSRYLTNEVKNGRLAMLAISGIVTQAALFPEKAFPFF
eukprot:gene7288-14865_t